MTGALAEMILAASIRSALAALLIGGVLLVARVRASGVRHAAWTAVLASMLLMPLLPFVIPAAPMPLARQMPRAAPLIERVQGGLRPDVSPAPALAAGIALETATRAATALPASGTEVPRRPLMPRLVSAAMVLYVLIALALLARLARGWRLVSCLARSSPVVDVPAAASSGPARRGVASRAAVCESGLVASPLTVGLTRPRIIFPRSWRDWPAATLRAVLAHERAHIERRDALILFVAHINCCLFWMHPLAWWLKRTLTATAEHACDEAAVKELGDPLTYSRVLMDMAEAVRRSGHRVAWQGVGVWGSGLLAERIDRVMRGGFEQRVSPARKATIALGCIVVIVAVVACRDVAVAPLEERPVSAAQQAERARTNAESEFEKAACTMTPQRVADTEAAWRKNREDLTTLKTLLIYYGSDPSGRVCEGSKTNADARRPLILWLIEHHPESVLTWHADPRMSKIDPVSDPIGYEQGRKLWLAHTARPGARAPVLDHAATFFEGAEPALTEEFLMRARKVDPKATTLFARGEPNHWTYRAAELYCRALRENAGGSFAQTVRRKLDASRDAELLAAVGWRLVTTCMAGRTAAPAELVALGKSYLERAEVLSPQSTKTFALMLVNIERDRRMRERLKDVPLEKEYEVVAALPGRERLGYLPRLANQHYYQAHYALSKTYAQDALTLATAFTGDPQSAMAIYWSNMTLARHALREGHRDEAVRYMLAAAAAPPSDELANWAMLPLLREVSDALLMAGERESVAAFYERVAPLSPHRRDMLLADATAVRAGTKPAFYRKQ